MLSSNICETVSRRLESRYLEKEKDFFKKYFIFQEKNILKSNYYYKIKIEFFLVVFCFRRDTLLHYVKIQKWQITPAV
jgi:hypothetical protein